MRLGLAVLFCLALAVPVRAREDAPPPRLAVTPAAVAGIWEGKLDVGAIALRLRFTLAVDPVGTLSGTMVSPDQGSGKVPCDAVTVSGQTVTIGLKVIKGTFTGKLGPDGRSLTGEWVQSGQTFPLELKKVEKPTEVRRPQTPKGPFPYDVADVTFDNPGAKITLAGTLTTPKGAGPFPAVVLVTGSGPQDRDETLFGHKPFWVLADYLARRGVAVLRCDDRGVGKSTGTQAGATSADFATDVFAAVEYVRKRDRIDPKKVGIAGHSEGGFIAPMVAVDHPDAVAFVVLLAGPGVPGAELLATQTDDILAAAGASKAVRTLAAGLAAALVKAVPPGTPPGDVKAKLAAAADAHLATLTPAQVKEIGWAEPGTRELALTVWSDPWQQYFLRSDPRVALGKVKCPVLALNGEKDLQVKASDNLAGIKAACPAATVRSFPGLNHLFQASKTGLVSEYGEIEQTLAPELLAAVADWVLALK